MIVMDQDRIEALLRFYETLAPDRLKDFSSYYAEDAYFKDPFNEVNRLEDIREIFARMFRQVADPRFVVSEKIGDARGLKPQLLRVIHGASHLRFGGDGKITYHRDYWDTGEELYAKLPLIGGAVRLLRRAFN